MTTFDINSIFNAALQQAVNESVSGLKQEIEALRSEVAALKTTPETLNTQEWFWEKINTYIRTVLADLPDFSEFVKSDDLPDFSEFVKSDDLPDFSGLDDKIEEMINDGIDNRLDDKIDEMITDKLDGASLRIDL